MSNETKREVFGKMKWELIRNLANTIDQNCGLRPREDATKVGTNYATRYDAALPDDLPVIPEAQSDWIKQCKENDDALSFALGDETTPIEVAKTFRVWGGYTDKNKDKWLKLQNTFARAWVLGVWKVKETDEVVKL